MAAAAARVVMAGIVTVANVWAAGGDTQPAMRCQQRRDHPRMSFAFNPSILFPFLHS